MAGVRAAIPAHRLARQPFAPTDGAGPTLQLGRPDANAAYYPRRAELTGLLSVGGSPHALAPLRNHAVPARARPPNDLLRLRLPRWFYQSEGLRDA